tara:strand:- start:521 stop:1360 length:840 start_codon:yes stop_codon:yes gene_type:complete
LQNKIKNIAIQGIAGSFHEEASRQFFTKCEIKFSFCDTFEHVFQQIKENNFTGVVAIENSLAGSILPNYGAIQSYNLNIIGETYRKIEQNLMALPGANLSNINEIWSHPMALRQCQEFLNKYPKVKSVEKEDTAKSAYLIKKNQLKNTAAIASETACKMYGMNILKKGIQSNKMNFTRFLILSKNKTSIKQPNKATLCFSVSNTTGSLAKVLTFLAENQMNLTKIQSHPKLGKNWEYFFYIDLLFSDYKKYLTVIEQLQEYVTELSILGAYKNGITNEL